MLKSKLPAPCNRGMTAMCRARWLRQDQPDMNIDIAIVLGWSFMFAAHARHMQILLTAAFAVLLSLLSLAASFAEVPRSEFVGNQFGSR